MENHIFSILPLSICLLITIVSSYDSSSCAYFSTHVVATPLATCASYSYQNTQYSWNFECDAANNINCNYYMSDTECGGNAAGSTPIDSSAGKVQCVGNGKNCHTVDIKIKGFTDTSTDDCTDETDFATYSFVIDECIESTLGGKSSSAMLSCDANKLYFEYYAGSGDCTGMMETYTYEYYDDLDGCWDVMCGIHEEIGVGTPSDETGEVPPETPPACEPGHKYMGKNNKEMGRKLVEMLAKPMDLTKAKYYESKKRVFANVLNGVNVKHESGAVINRIIMNWVYIVAVACAVILIAGAWRFIKQKEYTLL